jgi:Restriction endonuclease
MIGRSPGRYNLHRLRWTAFEDVCMQIMRVVLGETCTRFRPGADGGRDGWFEGVAAGHFANQAPLNGAFVIQCKHTSLAHAPLDVSDLKKEIEKLRLLAANHPCHYILMTNRQVTAQGEQKIRVAIESLPELGRCLVLAETWIEDTIDAHPRLLRMVPRLYGIGDLAQIVSFVLQEQTRAVLEDLAVPLRTFVPTDSYRRAERALHDQGFVVLVGPPASGKSAIAANLCLVNLAQNADVRVLRIEQADQFKSTWSPTDANTIYWVDDVFGETTLDEERLREWAAALDKVEAARKRGARIVFCTRDYILAAAERKLKRSKADFISDASVRVEVTALSTDEREGILYNHVKDGDITKDQKRSLKRHLPMLARLPSFSPELARRLGSKRFHRALRYEPSELRAFFDRPVQHFRDVIHGLSSSEMAALSACLHSGNALADPVTDGAVGDAVLRTYGVSIHAVRDSLDALEGSLVKRVRQATSQTWQLHHPSMIEALQEELAARSAQLALYLQSANLHAVLRDTTTELPAPGSRLLFVPNAAYEHLLPRLLAANAQTIDGIASYLADRASSELLRALDNADPTLLDYALSVEPEPEGADAAARLAVRLHRDSGLFGERRRELVEDALREGVESSGWCGFLDVEGLELALPELERNFVLAELEQSFPSMLRLYDWYAQDLSSIEHIDSAMEAIDAHYTRLREALQRGEAWFDSAGRRLAAVKDSCTGRLSERRTDIEEDAERYADHMHDEWKERYYEERYELENGRFSDVDE